MNMLIPSCMFHVYDDDLAAREILVKKANTDRQDAVFNADSNGGKCKPRSISEKQGSREEAEEDSKVDWS